MGIKLFAEYLAEFQQHIKNIGFDIDNQFFSDWLFMGIKEIPGTTRY